MMKLNWPCKGTVSSEFGFRPDPFHPGTLAKVWHSGMDIACVTGTEILSVYDGEVVFVGQRGGYGLCVIVKHPSLGAVWSLYGHLSQIRVGLGEKIKRFANEALIASNRVLALSGNTGNSTNSHLHLEIRVGVNGIAFARNPKIYLIK